MNTPAPPVLPPATPQSPPPEPRVLAAGRGSAWWGEGWRIFTAAPGPWLAITVVFVLIVFVLNVLPVVGALAQSLAIPVFAGGVMLGCRDLARGRPLTVTQLFAGFRSPQLTPLLVLGLINLVLGVVMIFLMAALVFGAAGTSGMSAWMSGSGPDAFALPDSIGAIALAGALVGLVFGTAWGMAFWFAPALVALDGVAPVDALKASFSASARNVGALLIYGLIFIGLAIVASIPFGLGWLVLGPVIAGSTYAGWREIFSQPA